MRVLRARSMSKFFPDFFMTADLFNYVVAGAEGVLYLYTYMAVSRRR